MQISQLQSESRAELLYSLYVTMAIFITARGIMLLPYLLVPLIMFTAFSNNSFNSCRSGGCPHSTNQQCNLSVKCSSCSTLYSLVTSTFCRFLLLQKYFWKFQLFLHEIHYSDVCFEQPSHRSYCLSLFLCRFFLPTDESVLQIMYLYLSGW